MTAAKPKAKKKHPWRSQLVFPPKGYQERKILPNDAVKKVWMGGIKHL